jgi:DNA-binding beta-propeller fold protein YncE
VAGPDGSVYVLDNATAAVVQFSPSGQPLASHRLPAASLPADLCGLAIAPSGALIVADAAQRCLHRLAPDGRPTARWDYRGLCPRCPATPAGLVADADGFLYVADRTGPALHKLSPAGSLLAEWRGSSHFGLFHQPAAIALDPTGCLYVADAGSHTIHRLSSVGEPLGRFGGEGSAPGQLRAPRGLALDPAGNLLVADSGNARVQRLAPSGSWEVVYESRGRQLGQLWAPAALSVGPDGTIYVADLGHGRLLVLSADGSPRAIWDAAGSFVSVLPHEAAPSRHDWTVGGLYFVRDPDGRLAVAKLLALDDASVHVRLYAERFTSRPPDGAMSRLTLDDPDSPSGLSAEHLALSHHLFSTWRPQLIRQTRLSHGERAAYQRWQAQSGRLWDLADPPVRPA